MSPSSLRGCMKRNIAELSLSYATKHVDAETDFVYLKESWNIHHSNIDHLFREGEITSMLSPWENVEDIVINKYLEIYSSLKNQNPRERRINTLIEMHDLISKFSSEYAKGRCEQSLVEYLEDNPKILIRS